MNIGYRFSYVILLLTVLFFFVSTTNAFQGGDGSLANPYQISTCSELQNISSCLNCNYTLVSNVNCNGYDYGDGFGFMPIGNCTGSCSASDPTDNPFNGTFKGNNFQVQNLFINRTTTSNMGLFGFSLGNIYDIGVTNAKIYGNFTVGVLIGAGYDGEVNNSYSTGNVYANNCIGGLYGDLYKIKTNNSHSQANIYGTSGVGGFVGCTQSSPIYNSYSTGNVYGDDYTGGFVGYLFLTYVHNSYSTGTVNGSGEYIGGFVGWDEGWIYDSYSTGNVYGDECVGGFLGGSDMAVTNSYSTGNVYGNNSVGGFAGESDYDFYTNCMSLGNVNGTGSYVGGFIGKLYLSVGSLNLSTCYWNNNSNNPNSTIGGTSQSGTLLGDPITVQDNLSYFYDCSNIPMALWDTSDTWFCSGNSLPYFFWQIPTSQGSGSGSIFPFESQLSLMLAMLMIALSLMF